MNLIIILWKIKEPPKDGIQSSQKNDNFQCFYIRMHIKMSFFKYAIEVAIKTQLFSGKKFLELFLSESSTL